MTCGKEPEMFFLNLADCNSNRHECACYRRACMSFTRATVSYSYLDLGLLWTSTYYYYSYNYYYLLLLLLLKSSQALQTAWASTFMLIKAFCWPLQSFIFIQLRRGSQKMISWLWVLTVTPAGMNVPVMDDFKVAVMTGKYIQHSTFIEPYVELPVYNYSNWQ